MTQTTEQERAHALAEKHGATSYRNRADTSNPAFGFTLGQLEALISEVEQAARRAPAVPVQPTSKQVVLGAAAILGQPEGTADNRDPNWRQAVGQAERAYLAMLAAAPQPPEEHTAETDSLGMPLSCGKPLCSPGSHHPLCNLYEPQPPGADHIPDAGKMVAAPVQLPEPVAKVEDGGLKWHIPDSGYSLPVRYLQGTHKLYTEQQVRQLLAAHGIGKDKQG